MMRKLQLVWIALLSGLSLAHGTPDQSINPLLGDKSFIEKFGKEPGAGTNENLRIRTHLEYVENHLKQKDVSHLSPAQQKNRIVLIGPPGSSPAIMTTRIAEYPVLLIRMEEFAPLVT